MRKFIRNRLINFIGMFGDVPWKNNTEPIYRILCYHRIRAEEQIAFQQQLDRLQEKFNFVTPEEFLQDKGTTNNLNLLLSFDDGYLDWETVVLDELDKRKLKAIFFVCPDFVNLKGYDLENYCKNNLKRSVSRPLTDDGLNEIVQRGHEIGNHLKEHTDLREANRNKKIRKIFESSQELFRQKFEIKPDWVAYPFADYFDSPDLIADIASDFFQRGVTLIPGWNTNETNNFLLHRDGFSQNFSSKVEKNWLRGGYDPIFRLTHLF